jgi:leucyl-tRNA---protein transferase
LDLQLIEPNNLTPLELDRLLALGWFRMQQTIFTTDFLYFDGEEYNAVWLRVGLKHFEPNKKYKTVLKRNSQFVTEIKPAQITLEHEILYQVYKQNISFDCAPSLHWLLFGNSNRNVYNTYMINIYGGNELIGTGFFDLGNSSAAGIISVYHPTYKKYSLGKYIILAKMNYCKQENFEYFYPGYFVPGYPMFDYKLGLGASSLEYFESRKKQWFPIQRLDK